MNWAGSEINPLYMNIMKSNYFESGEMQVNYKYQFKISMGFGKGLTLHHVSEGNESQPFVCEDATKYDNEDAVRRDSFNEGPSNLRRMSTIVDSFLFKKNNKSPYF